METMEPKYNDLDPLPLQLFVKNLDGKTISVQFPAPAISVASVKQRIREITQIPVNLQRLICGHQLNDDSSIARSNVTLHLSLRLPGGKGGFGSLLRGAASKAGQKKTSNFEACRDMSGRRLRHVNAEKKLEEWKAEQEGRKLEKIAEEFIKKKAKSGKKGVGDGETQKYVEKYRQESARCVAVVEESVRAAVKNGKRKALPGGVDAKKLKVWMGKKKLDESDGEDVDDGSSDDESSEESDKSTVLSNGNLSDSSKGAEVSCDSVADAQVDVTNSGSEEDKQAIGHQSLEFVGEDVSNVGNDRVVTETEIHTENLAESRSISSSGSESPDMEPQKLESDKIHTDSVELAEKTMDASVSDVGVCNGNELLGNVGNSLASQSGSHVEAIVEVSNIEEQHKPLNFDEFDSPKQMEVLGLERLKHELQTRGLKCGGTLEERAARLFLLKSIPLEKLPKKLLAKK